jgi:hypothetical protein
MFFIKKNIIIALVVFTVRAMAETTSTVTTITDHGGKATLTTNKAEYTFKVPKDSIVKHSFVTRDFVAVGSNNGKLLLTIDDIPSDNKLFYNLKLYKLPTRRDILLAIYDESITNNSQANEKRKSIIEFSGYNLKIYNREDVIFFRYDLKEHERTKTSVTISSSIGDEVLSVHFYKASNESMVMDFIDSFSLKPKS